MTMLPLIIVMMICVVGSFLAPMEYGLNASDVGETLRNIKYRAKSFDEARGRVRAALSTPLPPRSSIASAKRRRATHGVLIDAVLNRHVTRGPPGDVAGPSDMGAGPRGRGFS